MRKTSAGVAFFIAIVCVLAIARTANPQAAENPLGLKPDHITASVLDIDRAAQWYQEMLGFKLLKKTERPGFKSADLEIPGFGLGLVQTGQAGQPAQTGATAATPAAGAAARSGWLHIVFSVADPDKTFDILQKRGANVSTRGNTVTRPIKTFLIHDSEGNEIEIVQAGAS